jgi:carbamoyl-phosphate synthase large subunit
MKSTGEVMGLDSSFAAAFAKSQIAAGTDLPFAGAVFISVKDRDKAAAATLADGLLQLGFDIVATTGTASYLRDKGIDVRQVNKVLEGRPHIVDDITNGDIALIFNTTEGAQAIADSFTLRRAALTHRIPYYTTISGAKSAMLAIGYLKH